MSTELNLKMASRDHAPAPLDPRNVKAGDTVTLRIERRDDPVLTLSGETHNTGDGVYLGGWRLTGLPHYVTLTDHQPAPKPEWAPGTSGTATLNNLVSGLASVDLRAMRTLRDGEFGFAFANGLSIRDDATTYSVSDFVPDEPRPLADLTPEHLAYAFDRVMGEGGDLRSVPVMRKVLALLRGESR